MQKLAALFFFTLLVSNAVATSPLLIQYPSGGIYILLSYFSNGLYYGQKRWIPEPATFYNLFLDTQITQIGWIGYPNYFDGPAIDTLAILVQPIGLPDVYLLESGTLYRISPNNFNGYGFNPNAIVFIQPYDLQTFKRGPLL